MSSIKISDLGKVSGLLCQVWSAPGILSLFSTVRAACVNQRPLSHTQISSDQQWGGIPVQMPAQNTCRDQNAIFCHSVALMPPIHTCPREHHWCKLTCPASSLSKHLLSLLYAQCQIAGEGEIKSVLLTDCSLAL